MSTMVRDYHLPRPQWQPPDRLASIDHVPPDNRHAYQEQSSGDVSRPLSIEKALREQCRIPAQSYFVSVILDNGQAVIFSGPTPHKESISTFFNMERWIQCVTGQPPVEGSAFVSGQEGGMDEARARAHAGQVHGFGSVGSVGSDASAGSVGSAFESDRHGTGGALTRRRAPQDETTDTQYRSRKRARATGPRRTGSNSLSGELGENGEWTAHDGVEYPSKTPIHVGDEWAIWNIYDQRLRGLQQTACKLIAKAWVKLVEPKKQSTHPYTGSDEKAPDWWPKPWGTSKEERVRHKEPDHLYKKERVHLLKHILRMIVLPNSQQHPDIQKLNLNVAKLEEATYEALSGFFADKDTPNNSKKRPILRQIFLLARNEERYRHGEIDASTSVYVLADDKIPEGYQSDTEGGSPLKDADGPDGFSSMTLSPHQPGAQTLIAPARAPTNAMTGPGNDYHSTGGGGGGGASGGGTVPPGMGAAVVATGVPSSFIGDLPHRGPHHHASYSHPPPHLLQHHAEIGGGGEQHPGYVDSTGNSMAAAAAAAAAVAAAGLPLQEMVASPHDTSRRPTLFSPAPGDYGSSVSAAATAQQHQHQHQQQQQQQQQQQYSSWPPSNAGGPGSGGASAAQLYSFSPFDQQQQQHVLPHQHAAHAHAHAHHEQQQQQQQQQAHHHHAHHHAHHQDYHTQQQL